MKRKLFYLTALIAFCVGQSNAQKVLLPYGQFDKQPWSATCFSAASLNGEPENWYAKDFDDSNWIQMSGPVSKKGNLSYFNYEWDGNLANGVYWTRRHFTIDKLEDLRYIYFYALHDDSCCAYLNGTQIYASNSVTGVSNYTTTEFDETMKSLLVKGDNVLAVRVHDSGSGEAYMDYGLYAYSLNNGNFSNGSNGWTGKYDRTSRSNNTIAYRYGNDGVCNQEIADAATGLYHLTANACGLEYYNDQSTAVSHKNDPIPTVLYIDGTEQNIPSVFTEASSKDYSYCWSVNGKYVPYDTYSIPAMFNEGMYKSDMWGFFDAENSNGLNIGIRCKATDNVDRWAAWDNIDIEYYDESEVSSSLTSLIATYYELNKKAYNNQLKAQSTNLLENAANAESFKDKSMSFADLKKQESKVRKSIELYEQVSQRLTTLKEYIDKSSKATSPVTLAEGKKLYETIKAAHDNGEYEDSEISAIVEKLNVIIKRFGYAYLDVTVGVPGSLGDSILFKVENFVDVKSLKISGSLNDADLSIIKNNLSHLKELDIEDTNITEIPNNLFYQRSALEQIKLPSGLKTIGEYAFYQCSSLNNIVFPTTLTTIKQYSFRDCDSFSEINLNEGLKTLEAYAFYRCDNLQYVKFPSTLTTIGEHAFHEDANLEKMEFSEGLRNISYRAFYGCKKLNNLIFPNSLYYIGEDAFYKNSSLCDITFNEGLYQICDNAFYDCDALTEITLPSTLVLAYESPFDYCDNLRKVTCLAVDPPYTKDQMPYGVSMDGRELYVPELSIHSYKQHTVWSLFQTIKPIETLPQTITIHSDLHLTLTESFPAEYKPNVSLMYDKKFTSYNQYGSLVINGSGNLTIKDFILAGLDNNYQYSNSNRTKNYCSLINNSNVNAENVTISMWNRNDKWTFVSFPFNVKVSEIEAFDSGDNNWIIRKYDGGKRAAGASDQTWVKMNDDDILNAGEGYIMQSSRYVGTTRQEHSGFNVKAIEDASKNNIFIKDDATVELKEYESEYSHSRSWNLIGNPYPCYYDTRFMDFTAPITVWNMSNSTYSAYSPVDDKYILCPGEAFFVQRPIDNGTIIFSKDGRQTDRTARTIETPAKAYSPKATGRVIANVCISDGVSTDRTRIVMNEDALMDYEMDKDASKFMSEDLSVPQIYTSYNGVDFAINERPVADGTVDLDLHIGQDGLCTISLLEDIEDYKVMIEDKSDGSKTELSSGSDFTFMAKAGEIRGRFVLHFVNESTGINAMGDNNEEEAAIYSIEGVKVKSPAQKGIYIKNGKKIVVTK